MAPLSLSEIKRIAPRVVRVLLQRVSFGIYLMAAAQLFYIRVIAERISLMRFVWLFFFRECNLAEVCSAFSECSLYVFVRLSRDLWLREME